MSRTKRIYNKRAIGHNKWGEIEYHPYKELDMWCCQSCKWDFINAKRTRKLNERKEVREILKNWEYEANDEFDICEEDSIYFLCYWPGNEPDYNPYYTF